MNDQMVDLIADGYDLAIRIADLPDSSLIARKLATCAHVICSSPQYFGRHGRPLVPDDLLVHNCVIYSYQATGTDWLLNGPEGPISVAAPGNLRVNNGEAVRTALLAGVGIGYMPAFMVADDVRSGALVTVLQDFVRPDVGIFALYPHSRYLSAKVRAFVDFLVRRMAGKPFQL
jgi:DNA-binding transcriptional LysR family regulator